MRPASGSIEHIDRGLTGPASDADVLQTPPAVAPIRRGASHGTGPRGSARYCGGRRGLTLGHFYKRRYDQQTDGHHGAAANQYKPPCYQP